jgi:cellulose 1,4-beta-cellobiosidase
MAHKGDSSVPTNTVVTQEDGTPFPLTVSPASQLTVKNGSTGTLAVSLPVKPTQNVTVKTTVIDGSAQMSVSGGASLTFTTGNFSTPQNVTLQSVANQAGYQRVIVAPFGVDTPGYQAVQVHVLVS